MLKLHKKCSTAIYDEMLQQVELAFFQVDLLEHARQAVEYKKEFLPFGNLILLHHDMFQGRSKDILKVAAVMELLILSLDIFDDLEDQDNQMTPWSKWEMPLALNVATGLLYVSSMLIDRMDVPSEMKKRCHNLILQSINGQHTNLLNSVTTEKEYIETTTHISGSLVVASCLLGASLVTKDCLNLIEKYANYIGIIEQIKNDLQDIFSLNKNDWFLKKHSLPIIYLLEHRIPSIILDYYNNEITYEELSNCKELVKRVLLDSGAILYAQSILYKYKILATQEIKLLPVKEEHKQLLLEILQ